MKTDAVAIGVRKEKQHMPLLWEGMVAPQGTISICVEIGEERLQIYILMQNICHGRLFFSVPYHLTGCQLIAAYTHLWCNKYCIRNVWR